MGTYLDYSPGKGQGYFFGKLQMLSVTLQKSRPTGESEEQPFQEMSQMFE